jgi:imidazolonepropionase-like amidohydrolase
MGACTARRGSLDPGKVADIVAVPGNPLAEISLIEHVNFVMRAGIVVRDEVYGQQLSLD